MSRTTLVIGGTRNLGPDLVAALLLRGDDVTVLNRGRTPGDLPPAVERLWADRSDPAALAAALADRDFDLVVDTTLYTGAEARAVTRLLHERVGRYVFWSTGQVYLVRTGASRPFREEDYAGPLMPEPPAEAASDHENWVYGMGKRAAEDAFAEALASNGFPYLALRMPMINSLRDHYGRLAAYVRRLLDGAPIVVPDDQDSLTLRHVSGADVVSATLRAADPLVPAGTCVNVSQDEPLTLAAMLEVVGDLLGAQVRLAPVPRARLEAAGLLPACSPWSGRWMSELDNALSKRVLGMRYTPVAQYLQPLVRAARTVPVDSVPGYARRAEELALA